MSLFPTRTDIESLDSETFEPVSLIVWHAADISREVLEDVLDEVSPDLHTVHCSHGSFRIQMLPESRVRVSRI
jgi:hypothetical protein